jgi:predicted MFS family arabinose efflux permease
VSGERRRLSVIIPLGLTQTVAWASSYYLPAILARPIADDLGVPASYVYGALSGALIVAGLLGPRVGRAIDRFGGRELLCASNLVFALGLIVLASAHGMYALATAWLLLGIGMGAGLYEAAFATLTRLYGVQARSAITGIALIAGFASTVGWPLTSVLEASFGWRVACLAWAALHLLLALPLNVWLPRPVQSVLTPSTTAAASASERRTETRAMILVAYIFSATGFVSMGLSALLPTLLLELGATPAMAIVAAMLVGPAQVAARIVEASVLRRVHPIASTQLATVMHPLGWLAILFGGPVLAPVFAALYGAGNGVLTIARGTLPLAVFGPDGFGHRVGLLAMPARMIGALAPLALGLAMQGIGTHVLWITSVLSLSALVALFLLNPQRQ